VRDVKHHSRQRRGPTSAAHPISLAAECQHPQPLSWLPTTRGARGFRRRSRGRTWTLYGCGPLSRRTTSVPLCLRILRGIDYLRNGYDLCELSAFPLDSIKYVLHNNYGQPPTPNDKISLRSLLTPVLFLARQDNPDHRFRWYCARYLPWNVPLHLLFQPPHNKRPHFGPFNVSRVNDGTRVEWKAIEELANS
jgi:hypothetical protein